jgi:hypothetical protein
MNPIGFFDECLKNNFKDIAYCFHEIVDGKNGRIKIRKFGLDSMVRVPRQGYNPPVRYGK